MLQEGCVSKGLLNSQNMIYQVMIDGIKVDFVHHPFELVQAPFNEAQITFLGTKDIAAMKLHAIEISGNRAKDFADIYFLLQEIPLKNMFKYYQKKYSTSNIFNAKRSLGFFDDVPKEGWQELIINDKKVTVKKIKNAILNAIQEFNDEQMGK